MKILLDNEEVQCGTLKVIWDDTPDEDRELHMGVTCEGVILDVFDKDGELDSTASCETEFLANLCI